MARWDLRGRYCNNLEAPIWFWKTNMSDLESIWGWDGPGKKTENFSKLVMEWKWCSWIWSTMINLVFLWFQSWDNFGHFGQGERCEGRGPSDDLLTRAVDWRFIFKTLTECFWWQLNGTLMLRIFWGFVNFSAVWDLFDERLDDKGLLNEGLSWQRCFLWQFYGTFFKKFLTYVSIKCFHPCCTLNNDPAIFDKISNICSKSWCKYLVHISCK